MAAGESTVKDTTELAASQQEESEKGATGKQAIPVQQGTTSDATATTRPEQKSVRRSEPFALFDDLQQDMARLWDMLPWSRWPMSQPLRAPDQTASWRPTTDVYE